MKKRNKYSNLPRVTFILEKGIKKKHLYPSIRKAQFFLRNKAKPYLKNGYLITLRVDYGDGDNCGTYDNMEDLRLAFQAFVKEYID